MKSTLVHPTLEDRTAWGHGPLRPDGSRERAGFWELGFATPAGGMASSVEDLARFMRLQMAPCIGENPAVLSAAAIREMQRVQFLMNRSRGGSGLGWGVEISKGQHVVYHGGELPEQTSFLLIDLRTCVGIVVLSNAQDVDASDIAQDALHSVRLALGSRDATIPDRAIPPAP